jgi:hypothetical protein
MERADERHDLFGDRRREFILPCGSRSRLPQPRLPERPILRQPDQERALAYPQFLGHEVPAETLLQNQANGFKLHLRRIAIPRRSPRAAPGRLPLLHYLFVFHVTLHSFLRSVTPFIPRTWLTIWSLAQPELRGVLLNSSSAWARIAALDLVVTEPTSEDLAAVRTLAESDPLQAKPTPFYFRMPSADQTLEDKKDARIYPLRFLADQGLKRFPQDKP